MKTVLIICSSFPPQSDVGGLRPAMFAKYLREFGWDPWVLTSRYSIHDTRYDESMPIDLSEINNQIIMIDYSIEEESAYLRNRNFFTKIRDIFYPEYSCPPGLFFRMRKTAVSLLKVQKFDLIFSTSPDQWELTLGSWISKRYQIPLVADFRDIKEQEEGMNRSLHSKIQVFRFLFRRFLTSRKASVITTVSGFHARTLEKKLDRKTVLIYNGYDDTHFVPDKSTSMTKKEFTIIYIGRIINFWYQNPENLFLAIDQLIEERKISSGEIAVEFYGTDETKISGLMSKLKNPYFIRMFPRISFDKVPAKMNEADMLLLLTNRGRKGIITTKFFEYAGVRKPILCIPGDGNELDELLLKYELGYSISTIEELKDKLHEWIKLYRKGLFPGFVDSKIDFFTRRNQTKLLAEAFNSLIN